MDELVVPTKRPFYDIFFEKKRQQYKNTTIRMQNKTIDSRFPMDL